MSWFSKYKTYRYPNGDKYTGPIDEYGLRKGTGTYIEANGSKYVGDFLDDYQHGTGTYTFPNGDRYVGEWNNGDRDGHGCSTFGDAKHTGEYKSNLRNGYGIYETENGKKYSGNFVNGEMEGEGVFTELNSQGDRITYTGSYKKGKKNGYGVFVGEDGYKYSGEWKDGYKHGKGILEIPVKDNKTGKYYEKSIKYEGSFVKDKKEGFGILSYPLGFRYEGMFQNNERNGQGKALYPSGEYDEGIYKDGENWNVTEFSKNGDIGAIYIDGVKDDNNKREIKEELKVKKELPSSNISKTFNFTSNKGLYEAAKILGIKILEDQDYKLYYSAPHPMGEDIKPLMTDGNNVWYFENETFAEIADKNIAPEHLLFYDEDDKSVVLKVKVTTNDFIKISSFNEEQNLIREESFDIKNWKNTKIEHNPMNKMNDNLKPTNNKPLIEIGKILETDFYEDEKKNLYYRDFPDSSKLNEDSIYPLHSQERDFWVIKDGYTVNLSVVNWMDYNKMREGPHNEAELPNLYITLSTPNKVFELVFDIDGKLIQN